MSDYTQSSNTFRITTPLGPDALLLRRIRGSEGISELFDLDLEVLAPNDVEVPFDALLGQSVTVSVHGLDGSPVRHFNGICAELEAGPRETVEADKKTFTSYRLRVVPKVWLLGLVHRSRVFQEVAVPAILKSVFEGIEASYRLERTYEPREMCLQYRENDLAFACRLMEEEGIRFYFTHSDGSHVLVVTDRGGHENLPGASTLRYDPIVGGARDEDRITSWHKRQSLTRGKVTLRDRSFELPGNDLEKVILLKDSLKAGTVTHKLRLAEADKRELYGFPGGHAKPFDGVAPGGGDRAGELQKIFPYGETRARVVMEREETRAIEIEAASGVRHLAPGYQFTFDRHHDGSGAYLVTRVRHEGQNGSFRSNEVETRYENTFTCLPAEAVYRPPRATHRPVAQGPETAIVVGPSGEEIYVDKYGRIKVQFYWDREGKRDTSSCAWLRVVTPLAGAQWGSYAFPRIGQEVLVAFQHGDPDEPVVLGSLYNAENMPPYPLPANRVRTGLKTRSTLKGAADEFHEIRLDDTKDKEEIFVQSQKDFHRLVKNNDLLQVGVKKGDKEPPDGSQKQEIWKNRTVNVSKGDDCLNVGRLPGETNSAVEPRSGSDAGQSPSHGGNQTTWIANDRTTTLDVGNDKLVVGAQAISKSDPSIDVHQGNQVLEVQNDRTATVGYGNDRLTIKRGNLDIKLEGTMPYGKVTIEAPNAIELKVGGNHVKIDTMGIELKFGPNQLKLDAMTAELKTPAASLRLDTSNATLKGVNATLQGMAMTDVKAPVVSVRADGIASVGGAMTKIG
ncbi:MAG: type VI secretion system tip protein VgrG [Thermoanaerobaculia bacterium]|nr:type VI secretion system tip protein VgrG [Thermoanaerobaculia bacterium]